MESFGVFPLDADAAPGDVLRAAWTWLSADARQPYIQLFFSTYLRSVRDDQLGTGFAARSVTDWISVTVAAFGPQVTHYASAAVALLRGSLLDLLATDRDRVDAAMEVAVNALARDLG